MQCWALQRQREREKERERIFFLKMQRKQTEVPPKYRCTHAAGSGIRKTDPSILTLTRASRAGVEAGKGPHCLDPSALDGYSAEGLTLLSVRLLSSSPLAEASTLQALSVSLSQVSAPRTLRGSTGSGSSPSSLQDSDPLLVMKSTLSIELQTEDTVSLLS